MYIWLGIMLALAFLGIVEAVVNFSIPFLALRSVILFLLVLGMSYSYYNLEKGRDKELEED